MKTLLNVKTDVEVKREAQKVAKHFGVPLSVIVNAYLKEFIHAKEVRFSYEPTLRPEVGKLIKKQSKEVRAGKQISGPFRTADDLMKHLG